MIEIVSVKLGELTKICEYNSKLIGVAHYLVYEACCAIPSNFDANYTYGLGRVAVTLCCNWKIGYIAALSGLPRHEEGVDAYGVSTDDDNDEEQRHGKEMVVIKKRLVELDGHPFNEFAACREAWRLNDDYRSPGLAQFWGPAADYVTLWRSLDANSSKR